MKSYSTSKLNGREPVFDVSIHLAAILESIIIIIILSSESDDEKVFVFFFCEWEKRNQLDSAIDVKPLHWKTTSQIKRRNCLLNFE